MGKNVIISEQTVRDLLEAHASLSAWYYELWAAIRGGTTPHPPDDAARTAFVERLATDFPEIASVARAIQVPRMFVPPPPSFAVPSAAGSAAEPPGGDAAAPPPQVAPAPVEEAASPAPAVSSIAVSNAVLDAAPVSTPEAAPEAASPAIAPPPFVVPSQVKYEP
jgi:hypothetical protein